MMSSAEITQRSQTNFYYAFFFLPPARRRALHDVYAFCRLIDDIVDGPGTVAQKAAELSTWRHELEQAFHGGHPAHPVARRLQESQRQFGLRHEDALAVLSGCEMDLHKTRYTTWEELYDYCYRVASSVGLLCIALFGCTDPRSREYAIHLGQALQLTNILRDISEDAARDRLYVPLEILQEFGLGENEVMSGAIATDKRAAANRLIAAMVSRAREEYRLARLAPNSRDRLALLPAEIMRRVYLELLVKLERQGAQTLYSPRRRAKRTALSRPHKLFAAFAAIASTLLPFQT
jgi:phytoene synthase